MSMYRINKSVSVTDLETAIANGQIVSGTAVSEYKQAMSMGARDSDLVHDVNEYRNGTLAWPISHVKSQGGRLQKALKGIRFLPIVAQTAETPSN